LVGQIENLTRIVMQLSDKVAELSERIENVAELLTQGQGRDGDTEGRNGGHRNSWSQWEAWQYLSDGNMQGVNGNMESIAGTHSQGPNQ